MAGRHVSTDGRSVGSIHLAVAGPMDVPRLARELALAPTEGAEVPTGHGGHPVTELVLALRPLVGDLDLVTLDPGIERPVTLCGDGVRLAVGPYRPRARTRGRDLFAAERSFVAARLREFGPAVVSAHWTYEYGLGALDSGHRTLITVHDWGPTILRHARDRYRALRLVMQLLAFARGRDFAAVSPYMARKVRRFARRPCAVLPNGVGATWFECDRPSSDGQSRVLAVNSGFDRRKNVQALLRAWPTVLAGHPDAELVLAGEGYEEDGPAYRWARARGLARGVRFLGPVARTDLPELFRAAAVFAHPALEESFGMVILEAMAIGVPVLGGAKSGAVPWLLEGGAGRLVDVRDPAAIGAGLANLLDEPEAAAEVAARGRDRARRSFTSDVVASAYVRHLTSIAATRP